MRQPPRYFARHWPKRVGRGRPIAWSGWSSIDERRAKWGDVEDGMNPIEMLFELLRREGKAHYEGTLTQFEHAIQCATLAEQDRASPALITASLFHDLGHLVNPG